MKTSKKRKYKLKKVYGREEMGKRGKGRRTSSRKGEDNNERVVFDKAWKT